jgi:hypothetical protein
MIYHQLNPEKALIWRIVHRDNLAWTLDHGLHCANSNVLSPKWIDIGNVELIDKRRTRDVPIRPGGKLADYVPFYFTPFSIMMKNVHSGRGVQKRNNEEIVILVSSLHQVQKMNLQFVFTNAHAYAQWADFYSDPAHLSKVDWPLLQKRDFKRDADDPDKIGRYQAEALIHQYLPIQGVLGIVCYTDELKQSIEQAVLKRRLNHLQVFSRTPWYF